MNPIPSERRERLSTLMEDRRLALGLSWRDVAQRAGLAYETVRALRTGHSGVQSLTAANLDRALQWQTGSVERILDGGEPLPASEGSDAKWESLTPDERFIVEQLVDLLLKRRSENSKSA